MNPQHYIRAGRLDEALADLQNEVRSNPADARLRTFLFQLLCLRGEWKRALTQLQVLSEMNPETMMLARVFEPVLSCEILRKDIFDGKRTPIIFGEPVEWMGLLVQANELVAKGEFSAAQELRDQAFAAAPATSGAMGKHAKPESAGSNQLENPAAISFEWIADADVRLGPMLEAIVEGHYYWIPFCRIKRIYLEPPADLRDLVWAPAQFVWANGGEAPGHIPTRYPATAECDNSDLRLARRTEWLEREAGYSFGLGQRTLATDVDEFPLLECRTIDLAPMS